VYLARNPDRVITHRALLAAVWGPNSVEQTEYLRVCIGHLRKKLEPDEAVPRYIVTEPWVGYRFEPGQWALSRKRLLPIRSYFGQLPFWLLGAALRILYQPFIRTLWVFVSNDWSNPVRGNALRFPPRSKHATDTHGNDVVHGRDGVLCAIPVCIMARVQASIYRTPHSQTSSGTGGQALST